MSNRGNIFCNLSTLQTFIEQRGEKMRRDALEQLYIRYYRPTFLYMLSLCKDRQLAEDIVSDAFVKAFLTLSDESGTFNLWLLRVCRNLWIDQLRRTKRNDGDMIPDIPDTETPELHYLKDERLKVLYDSIGALRAPDRELLALHYFSGLGLRDIAQLLHVTQGSAKTRLFRARRNLRDLMEEKGYEF